MDRPTRYDQLSGGPKKRVSNVEPLARKPRRAGTYISQGSDGDRIQLVWPTPSGKLSEQAIDVSHWACFPHLWKPFADVVTSNWGPSTARTRKDVVGRLDRGWWTFLEDTQRSELQPHEISAPLFGEFLQWLNRTKDSTTASEARWHVNGRRKLYGAAYAIVKVLQERKAYGVSDFYLPSAVFPQAHTKTTNRAVIPRPILSRLLAAADREARATMKAWKESRLMIATHRERAAQLASGAATVHGEYQQLGLVVAVLHARYPDILPTYESLKAKELRLASAISRKHGGLREIEPRFYMTFRALVPFFLLLQYFFAANTETLLGSLLDDFRRIDLLGSERILYFPQKWKAGGGRVPRSYQVTEDATNPSALLDFLLDWTAVLRPLAHPVDQGKLWLVVSRVDPRRAGRELIPVNPTVTGQKSTMTSAVNEFLARNGLPLNIALNQIRPTSLDVVDELFGGDIRAVAAAGSHRSLETTDGHYTSGAAKQRDNQSVSLVQATRDRWQLSKGKIDPRGEPEEADQFCATPGWQCGDPFDSPWPWVGSGRLCNAYGFCPLCPLASVNTKSPYSLARLLQLRHLIIESVDMVSVERWLEVWSPALQALDGKWLPQFKDKEVINAAATTVLSVLPPLD